MSNLFALAWGFLKGIGQVLGMLLGVMLEGLGALNNSQDQDQDLEPAPSEDSPSHHEKFPMGYVNPATGLPMMDGVIDVAGNTFGMDNNSTDFSWDMGCDSGNSWDSFGGDSFGGCGSSGMGLSDDF